MARQNTLDLPLTFASISVTFDTHIGFFFFFSNHEKLNQDNESFLVRPNKNNKKTQVVSEDRAHCL